MPRGGQTPRLLPEVIEELKEFARDGRARWRSFSGRSRLPSIERFVREHHELSSDQRPAADLVCDAIRQACASLPDEDWREAALIHLGFEPNSPPGRIAREDDAAQCLLRERGRMSGRTYRATIAEGRHSGRKYAGNVYDSWSEVILASVAEALISQFGGSLESGEEVRSDDSGPCLGDAVRRETSAFYRPIKIEDFSKSFFHRPSTEAYIDQLASLSGVTLYTGGAISTEVHAPLSDTLVAAALKERLRHGMNELNGPQRKRVIDALMRAYPPAHLGSIAREYVREQMDHDPAEVEALEEEAQRVFAGEFRDALYAGHDTGGFLALGIGVLAFTLRKQDRDPVRVLTTSYDDKIIEAEARVKRYFQDLEDFAFDPRPLEESEEAEAKAVPLYRLNGHVPGGGGPDALIVGEADALTSHYQDRGHRIERALAETACIFVGTELTEPDVISKLVNAPYPEGLPRYALVLPPEFDLAWGEERAKVLNLAARRFLHLGVVPIQIDFPHQAPQFLIEVALRIQQGKDDYRSYATRLQDWWDGWAKKFGFANGRRGAKGRRDRELQEEWMKELEKIRSTVARDHLEIAAGDDEQIELEVWIRHPDERSLILWSTSDGLWLNSYTADRCYIHKGDDSPVQRSFREGTPVFGKVDPPRGGWRFQLSIPLVLRRHPWHHLPVGVVNILSSKDPPREDDQGKPVGGSGKLGTFSKRRDLAVDLGALTSMIRKPINDLLDPHSSRWEDKKRTQPTRKRERPEPAKARSR
jgi:hypothetical protein